MSKHDDRIDALGLRYRTEFAPVICLISGNRRPARRFLASSTFRDWIQLGVDLAVFALRSQSASIRSAPDRLRPADKSANIESAPTRRYQRRAGTCHNAPERGAP
jgi:hypothetical protein